MKTSLCRLVELTLTVFILISVSECSADEIVLDGNSSESQVRLGDCDCSYYRTGSDAAFPLPNPHGLEISTGELWRFFEEQGLDSVNSIVICVDVEQLEGNQEFGLDSLSLKIQDPADHNRIEHFSFGDHSLVLPGNTTQSECPECRLAVNLGFDFMQKYSSSSTEKLVFDIGLGKQAAASKATFFIEGKRSWLTWPNVSMLIGFVAFWACAFFALKRYTLPSPSRPESAEPNGILTLPIGSVAAESAA